MSNDKLYVRFARTLGAYRNCVASNNVEWIDKHLDTIKELNQLMPHGSGLDHVTDLDLDASSPDKLVFGADYHHMNNDGYYDGWTEHQVIVTPSLQFGFDIKVTGRNRNDVKDYIAETFSYALSQNNE